MSMTSEYPNPCCRCGFCCISAICPVAKSLGAEYPCPYLSFEGDISTCGLVIPGTEKSMEFMGIGKGCCIKARAFKNGIENDFASLPSEIKQKLVQSLRKQGIGLERR
jgi:Fe-S cluster biogenesis protein NfuA